MYHTRLIYIHYYDDYCQRYGHFCGSDFLKKCEFYIELKKDKKSHNFLNICTREHLKPVLKMLTRESTT